MKPKVISLGLTAALLAAGVFIYLHLPPAQAKSPSASSAVPKAAAKQPIATPQTYSIYAGLWRTDGGFVSTIRIKNELVVAPLDVTPALYMTDGTRYELPVAHVPVAGVAFVNVNDALAKAPPKLAGHVSEFGSAELRWQYTSAGHVVAFVEMLNVPQSLIFIAPFNGIDSTMSGKQRLEGLWWRHDAGVNGYVTVANVTGDPVEVRLGATGAHGAPQPGATVDLPAHTTQVLHLHDLLALPPGSPENQAGGVQVEYNGPMGSIIVTGGLANAGEGYSANMPFWFQTATKEKPARISYASVGVMAGQPDPMRGFPAKTSFTPYLVLRNTTNHPLPVNGRVNYMANGAPVSQAAPPVVLAPFESRQVGMKPVLDALGLAGFNGNLNLKIGFTGHGSDLVVATGSVDQTGTYVFEVEPKGIGQSLSQISALWTTANGFDTMWNLLNPTNKAEDLTAIFYYGDGSGSYKLPIHLAAHGSTMVDMAMLRMSQQPDANGHTIPATVQTGSAVFESAQGRRNWITVVIASGVYNVVTATCNNSCVSCCGYSMPPTMSPSSFAICVGQTTQCVLQATDCQGYVDDIGTSYSSEDTSVMTVDNGGNVTGVAGGSTAIDASGLATIYTGTICAGWENPSCPQSTASGQAPGTGQMPTSLKFIATTSQGAESTCTYGSSKEGAGYYRQIMWQVLDQNGQPILQSNIQVRDSFANAGGTNTCGFSQQGGTTGTGYTDSNGKFPDSYSICSSGCLGGGNCQSTEHQTWTVSGITLSSDIKTVVYTCNGITINGQ